VSVDYVLVFSGRTVYLISQSTFALELVHSSSMSQHSERTSASRRERTPLCALTSPDLSCL
jgi:hypothetical protein